MARAGRATLGLIALACCACGGGAAAGPSGSGAFTAGVFPASSSLAAQCAQPRSGTDPVTGRVYPDRPGSTYTENLFLRSWTHELYLWYREVPDVDPGSRSTADYFNLLKTSAVTPSGRAKDRFHFTYTTEEWERLSQSGVEAGYGLQWALIATRPPRNIVVAYTEPLAPAPNAAASLARGTEVLAVDGADVVNGSDQASVDRINAGLFPQGAGETHTFSVRDVGAGAVRTVTLVSALVTSTPVQHVQVLRRNSGAVGYMLFNDHLATSEAQLVAAFAQLAREGVDDLVLDIRYNGGGYLAIASEVAYMVAGPGPTTGVVFERTMFNDQHPTTDPVTGQPLEPTPFYTTAQGFSAPEGSPLPSLGLSRVFVLTGASTCSASEAVINGLRGAGIEVIAVGATTCGKPYGFYARDNCGTTYFSINFTGVNAQGFGEYPDGFSPANVSGAAGVRLPGCAVADDFAHALGDTGEARLAAALSYRTDGSCPPVSASSATAAADAAAGGDVLVPKSPWRTNRILVRRP